MINIRDLSVKCGQCDTYQTLSAFRRRDEWNVYVFECDDSPCDPEATRTLVEVPRLLDEFATRDSEWEEGRRFTGGAHPDADSSGD